MIGVITFTKYKTKSNNMSRKKEQLISVDDYVYLNNRGFPASTSYKYRLIRREKNGGLKAPFKWVAAQNKYFVVT